MKKFLSYLLVFVTLVILLVPTTAEAKTTKVAKPTYELRLDSYGNGFDIKFTCSTKGSKVRCKNFGLTETYKLNKWYYLGEMPDEGDTFKITFYAYKGKVKSKKTTVDIAPALNKLWIDHQQAEKQELYDIIRAEIGTAVEDTADSFTKLAQIINYFGQNFTYAYDEYVGGTDMEVWKTHNGVCYVLAVNFSNICLAYNINCDPYDEGEFGYYAYDHMWCVVYLDNKPIIVDPTQLAWTTKGVFTKQYVQDTSSWSTINYCKNTGENVLEFAIKDYYKFEKDKITNTLTGETYIFMPEENMWWKN